MAKYVPDHKQGAFKFGVFLDPEKQPFFFSRIGGIFDARILLSVLFFSDNFEKMAKML